MEATLTSINCFLCVVWLFATTSCTKTNCDPDVLGEVHLAAVLDLSGIYSEDGLAGKASIEMAISDLNQRYETVGSTTRFHCLFIDSKMDTSLVLSAVETLHNPGIRLLVGGPNTSAELNTIKNFMDSHSMLNLNCFSTAPSLAIAGDNIFRLIPDDNVKAQALTRMMQYDNIEVLIPEWRNDTFGIGLKHTVRNDLFILGKTVMTGVHYNPGNVDFSYVMSNAALQVNEAITTYGANHVAVLLISYQDAADFFIASSDIEGLGQVRWYGCDANSQKSSVIAGTVSGAFAEKVRFVAPVLSAGSASAIAETAKALSLRIYSETGLHPDDMALSAYDAVMILGQCCNLTQSADPMMIKNVLDEACGSYNYLGINRSLNETGDLKGSNFIFWTVEQSTAGYAWNSYATWFYNDNKIVIKL